MVNSKLHDELIRGRPETIDDCASLLARDLQKHDLGDQTQ